MSGPRTADLSASYIEWARKHTVLRPLRRPLKAGLPRRTIRAPGIIQNRVEVDDGAVVRRVVGLYEVWESEQSVSSQPVS